MSEFLLDLLCTEEEVCGYLQSLDTTKATGSNGLSAKMLKETAASITPAVTKLFNISLQVGELPAEWKHAIITPIPKSNNLSSVSNYRPISLLPLLSKVLERHVHSLLMKHLCSINPMSNSQFVFLKGRSTIGALVSAVDDWHTHLDNGLEVCVVFFDLKKACKLEIGAAQAQNPGAHRRQLEVLSMFHHQHLLLEYSDRDSLQSTDTSKDLYIDLQVSQEEINVVHCRIDGLSRIQLSDGTLILFAHDIVVYRPIRNSSDFMQLQNDVDTISN